MLIRYELSGTIEVPDGSQLDIVGPRGILLPDGGWVKLFVIPEINDDRDLPWAEALNMGIDINDLEVKLTVDV